MALPDLTDQFISDLYPGLLHTANVPVTSNAPIPVYDGLGNPTSLRLGGVNASVGGMLAADNLTVTGFATYIDYLYPIGSIYLSANNVNPQSRFAGTTWVNTSKGRFIVGVGTGNDGSIDKTFNPGNTAGGYNHTLSVPELPSHNHTLTNTLVSTNDDNAGAGPHFGASSRSLKNSGSTCGSLRMGFTGKDIPHNNTPPGFGVYVWERIG